MSKKPDTSAILTEEQKHTLLFIYEGEKAARDIYIALNNIHKNESTFSFMKIEVTIRQK